MNRARFLEEAEAEFLKEVQYYADVQAKEAERFRMAVEEAAARGRESMKLRLAGGFGTIRNIVPVTVEKAGSRNGIVGDMDMLRRSGWRGGPTYHFYPNEHGEALGLKGVTGSSVRQILGQLGAETERETNAE